jgi:hypothetical protein
MHSYSRFLEDEQTRYRRKRAIKRIKTIPNKHLIIHLNEMALGQFNHKRRA